MNIANFKEDYFPSKTQIKYVSLLGVQHPFEYYQNKMIKQVFETIKPFIDPTIDKLLKTVQEHDMNNKDMSYFQQMVMNKVVDYLKGQATDKENIYPLLEKFIRETIKRQVFDPFIQYNRPNFEPMFIGDIIEEMEQERNYYHDILKHVFEDFNEKNVFEFEYSLETFETQKKKKKIPTDKFLTQGQIFKCWTYNQKNDEKTPKDGTFHKNFTTGKDKKFCYKELEPLKENKKTKRRRLPRIPGSPKLKPKSQQNETRTSRYSQVDEDDPCSDLLFTPDNDDCIDIDMYLFFEELSNEIEFYKNAVYTIVHCVYNKDDYQHFLEDQYKIFHNDINYLKGYEQIQSALNGVINGILNKSSSLISDIISDKTGGLIDLSQFV